MRNLYKFRGCLLGGAAGDALGYEVEFMREWTIKDRFGPDGITEYALHDGKALISDDTQMTLFTANGLLTGTTRGRVQGITERYESYIAEAYIDWLRTQQEDYPLPGGHPSSWLVNIPELFARRAPGNACLSGLGCGMRRCEMGSIANPVTESKGCGGVMRVAPIGLYFVEKLAIKDADMIAAEAAAITHGHELGYIPAAALAHVIYKLTVAEEETVLSAVEDALVAVTELFPNAVHLSKFIKIAKKAIWLSSQDIKDVNAIRQLGEGWVAEETFAIAAYCALKYSRDFDKAIIAAVNHDGDSDSTGAVTGNILGAYLGLDGIPMKYQQNLELRDVILDLADDLCNDCKMSEFGDYYDETWEHKYIRVDYGKRYDTYD